MNNILDKNLILAPSKPIPADSIVSKFDAYFRSNLNDYYDQLTHGGEEIYIPTYVVLETEKAEIYDCIQMFFKNETNFDEIFNEFDKEETRRKLLERFEDGKIITRILMGVNTGEVSWKIYGERKYWMCFKNKNYHELLEVVREMLQRYRMVNRVRDRPPSK